ncbi:hypothetical protein DIS24_g6597 [Lasiodiplodia hormozganensis]|uniref:F-box domain-containing protein n=1 Tax=Lasiodiplodia hormozganensis TaxID=869390 RepID=A0AA40CU24_9PEZI|nr:hypothetical protein DIS24_g6597 [Lasiodiplodia hormozganensis]
MPFLCGPSRKPDEDHAATTPHKTSTIPSSPHVTSTAPSSPHETSTTPSCQVTDSTTDDASISDPSHDSSPSILHRLPLDLLYYLTTHHLSADAADVLALSATSRAFHTPLFLIPTGPPTAASINATRSFLKRLNYDRFTRACAAEREEQQQQQQQQHANNNDNSEQQRPCSACVSVHPPSLFSSTQLARAPEQRRCKGAEGVVRMCRHMAFTYDKVASAMAAAASNRDLSSLRSWFLARWQCHHCEVEAYINADSNGHRRRLIWPRSAELIISSGRRTERLFGLRAQLSVVVAVGEVRRGESLTLERVLGVLAAAAIEESGGVVVVCRHVRFGDPRTFRTRPWNLGDAGGSGNGQILISSHECLEPGCHMMACLFWKRSRLFGGAAPDEPVVELEITRHLGYMLSPSSEWWLAQIEEEG